MREVTLVRDSKISSKLGTFGDLDTGTFRCKILERPKPGLVEDHPCIPPTDRGYDVEWTVGIHPRHPDCYEVNVPGRSAILFHSANWYQELLGCLAPGAVVETVMDVGGKHLGTPGASQIGVSNSRSTLDALIADLKKEPFRLIIKEI